MESKRVFFVAHLIKQEETTSFASKAVPWAFCDFHPVDLFQIIESSRPNLHLGVANPLRVYSFCSEPTLVSNSCETGGTVFEIAKTR